MIPEATGRPAIHPGALLKIYVYDYINQIASSRRLEREAHRNVELMWLTERLTLDFKTIADFRKDNGPAIRGVCRQFIALCRQLGLFAHAVAAIDGSKFKAVNARDKNFTKASIQRRMEQVEASIERYMAALETADRQDGELAPAKSVRLKDKIAALKAQMQAFKAMEAEVHAAPDQQISLTDPDARAMGTSGKGTLRNAAPLVSGLGRACLPTAIVGFFHGAVQPHLDQMQHAPINDPASYRLQ